MQRFNQKKWLVLSIINLVLSFIGVFFALKIASDLRADNPNINSQIGRFYFSFSFITFLLFIFWGLAQFFAFGYNENLYLKLNDKYILAFLAINQIFSSLCFVFVKDFSLFLRPLNDLLVLYVEFLIPLWSVVLYFFFQKPKKHNLFILLIFTVFPLLTLFGEISDKLLYIKMIIGYLLILVLFFIISKIKPKKRKKSIK